MWRRAVYPSPMRIGIYTEIYQPVLNGVVISVESFREQLRARGHEVYIFTPSYMQYADPSVLPFHSLPLPTRTPYRLATPFLKQGKIPRLDLIHAQTPFMTGLMAWKHARRANIPLVFTYHTRLVDYYHYLPFSPPLSKGFLVWVSRTFGNMADRVVVPATPIKALLESYGVHTPIDVVPTDVRLRPAPVEEGVRVRAALGIPPGHRVLLYVGRLAREKNLGLLLDAYAQARTPDTHFVLVGDGPSREWLQRQVEERGLTATTHLVGAVEHAEIPAWYRAADLFVFSSLTETQGLVVEEALQLGVPVLAVEAGGVIDAIGRWEGGCKVAPCDDADELTGRYAAALHDLLEHDGLIALRHAAENNLRGHAANDLSTRRLIKVYESAIDWLRQSGRRGREKFQLSQK